MELFCGPIAYADAGISEAKVTRRLLCFLKPDKTLLDKYIQSLDDARKQMPLMKRFCSYEHIKVVLDSLMDITNGVIMLGSIPPHTFKVYDDIQEKAQKQYRDEVEAHKQTRENMKSLKN